tara:strand:- start:370 stop:717 length:348 start_codon:yes stop_codon:yes gene_type:complete
MASLSSKVSKYAADNGVASIDFTTDVLLQDDSNGQGPYIKEWNLDIAKPTDAQLSAVEAAADLSERQNAVRATRRAAYGNLGDQLDMQYHDNVNGTTTWKDHVAKVKSDNPIPTE